MNRLDEIEARANAATPGPWEVKPYDGWHKESDNEISSFVGPGEATIVEQLGCGCCDVGLEVTPADAELIAHSRTDVPALAAVARYALSQHAPDGRGNCGPCDDATGEDGWPCSTVREIHRLLGEDV